MIFYLLHILYSGEPQHKIQKTSENKCEFNSQTQDETKGFFKINDIMWLIHSHLDTGKAQNAFCVYK